MAVKTWVDCPVNGPVPAVIRHKQTLAWTNRRFYCGAGLYGDVERAMVSRYGRNPTDKGTVEYGDRKAVLKALDLVPTKGDKNPVLAWCAACNDFHRARETETVSSSRADKDGGLCGGACLNGKRECSCPCGGQCHGAGVCTCGKPNDAMKKAGKVAGAAAPATLAAFLEA